MLCYGVILYLVGFVILLFIHTHTYTPAYVEAVHTQDLSIYCRQESNHRYSFKSLQPQFRLVNQAAVCLGPIKKTYHADCWVIVSISFPPDLCIVLFQYHLVYLYYIVTNEPVILLYVNYNQ